MTPEPPRAKEPLLISFGSSASGACRQMDAILDHVLQAGHNHGTFRRRAVDVDRSAALADRFGVGSVPTILVIDRGAIAARIEGRASVGRVRETLSPWLR